MSEENTQVRNVIILGSGPAGLTAAIYTARARLNPLVIAGTAYGGQLMTTTLVENFPGFAAGVDGPVLMQSMIDQAKNQGADFIFSNATKVDFSSDIKKIWVGETEYQAKAVILAVGSRSKTLDIPGEKEFWAKGVSTCATCDGAFFRDKVVAIVGGGDSAMEEAMFLTKFTTKVYLIHRSDAFRASVAMQERVKANDKIEILWNTKVIEILGDKVVNKLKLEDTVNGEQRELEADGMFLAIGHIPNVEFLEGQIELDEAHYVKQVDKTNTSISGVFVAGELIDKRYKQAVVTAGMGCMAAMDVAKWLSEQE